MKRFLMFVGAVLLSLATSGLVLAQNNPAVGTWKINSAKSKYSPGETGAKSRTRTVEAQGDAFKITVEGVAADGSHIAYSYTTKYDGKDSPISGVGTPDEADTIATKRVDANTTTAIEKKAGKVVVTTRTVVSKDGKITTVTSKSHNKQGRPTTTTTVYEKQ